MLSQLHISCLALATPYRRPVDEPAPAYFETSTSKSERVAVVSIPIHRPDPGAATEKPAGLGLKA